MKNDKKRKELVEYWNKNVLCNLPSKKESRKSKRKLRSMKRELMRDFEVYMNAVEGIA